jgi:hypothetical protein
VSDKKVPDRYRFAFSNSAGGNLASGNRLQEDRLDSILRKIYHDNAVRWIPGIIPPHESP